MAAIDSDRVSAFEEASAPLRRALLAHCYRILGTWEEAEDAVQETHLWGWLYRIATNVCLNGARDRGRRALPSGIGAPTAGADEPTQALTSERWIQPFEAAPQVLTS